MANDIQLKRSSVAGRVPDAANVLVGEPVINLNDKIIFTKDGGGNVIVIGAGTTSNVIEGSNLYFSNARVSTAISTQTLGNATFSSDVNVRGELFVTGAGGDEGGQITLAPAVTNSTLAGQVVIDVFQNKLRFFEKGGSNRGAYIDLSTGGASAGTSLISSGSGTITSVAGVSSGAVSNAQLATATVTSQTLTNATFSANVTADRFFAGNNGNSENYRIGDDVWIGDYNIANSFKIKGIFNADQAYISFGTSNGDTLGRNGLSALTYTAGFAAANVVASGNITAGNITISSNGVLTFPDGTRQTTAATSGSITSVNGRTGAVTGLAETANALSQFASTTSSQLAGVISDETGSGALVFATTPTLVTPVLGLATGTSVMLSANVGAAAGNVSGNFTAGNFQTAGNVNAASALFTGAVTAGTLQTSGAVSSNSLTVAGNINLRSEGSDYARIYGELTGATSNLVLDISDDVNSDAIVLRHTSYAGGLTPIVLDMASFKRKDGTNATIAFAGDLTVSANVNVAAGLATGNFTAANFQTAGNVNSAAELVTGALTAGTLQTSGNVNANNLRVVTNSSLGTVVSGTWNGASISTTYTDAKVTSVNGQTGAATGFATTANSLSQFASTTSAQLAGVISDETGTGSLVFANGPTLATVLATAVGSNTSPALRVSDTLNRSINFLANVGGGSYTPLTTTNDSLIYYTAGSPGSGNLVIAPWASYNSGIKLDAVGNTIYLYGSTVASNSITLENNVYYRQKNSSGVSSDILGVDNSNTLRLKPVSGGILHVNPDGGSSPTYLNYNTTGSVVVGDGTSTTSFIVNKGNINATTGNISGSFTAGTIQSTGNLNVAAGLITGNFSAGNFQTAGNVNMASGLATGAITAPTLQSTGNVNAAAGRISGNFSTTGVLRVSDTTPATGTGTGAAIISGGASVAGNLYIGGNLYVAGTTTTLNSNVTILDDPIIYLADNSTSDILDIGLIASFNNGVQQHTGFVRDASDGIWKLFANVIPEPNVNGTVDFTNAVYSPLTMGALSASSGTFSSTVSATSSNVNSLNELVSGSLTAGTIQTAGNVNANNLRVVTNSSLGTVVQGTWNGSSISTTYTDAKVTSVNGQTGAATGFATTANTLAQFASTTSAQLATLISDETGSGALVFATTPTLVTPVLGLATGTSVMLSANVGAAAGNVSGNFTAGNFQTAGNVNSAAILTTGNSTAGNYQSTGNINVAGGLVTGSLTAGTLQASGNVNANNLSVVTNSSLGTVVSGTWNGASISTTYTDAKVVSVNGSTGAVTGLATTAGTLAQFGATTSSQLAGVISDETGSGALVFATTPTLVTPVLGLATGTSVMLSANIGAAAGNVSGNFTAGNFQTAGNVNSQNELVTGSLTAGTLQTSGNVNASSLRVTTASSLGTVQSGTWNGSSISTTYTDAKVTTVAGSTGAISNAMILSALLTVDGASSGLDADLLDGQSSSYYLDTSSTAQTKTGNITLVGTLSATTKSFVIKHPTKEGMQLRYGSLEGPENGVYVRGKLKGSSVIDLPEYWVKLVDPESISVQLTPIGRHQKLFVEDIIDNSVIIGNDGLFAGEINCFYTIFAERVDVGKLQVEI